MPSVWLTPVVVRTFVGVAAADVSDEAALTMAADAAAEFVEDQPHLTGKAVLDELGAVVGYSPKITLGAAMLAYRWYSRRGSPLGIAGYSELGASGIMRYDPDIGRLLKLDGFGPFVFGAPRLPTTEV